MDEYLDNLNTQQREAVLYTDGPALVIAGAGSGKTRVLTYKIVHLLHHGYEPWRILALTFTNKAAKEMRERIEQLVGNATASRIWMGTFHSIFSKILHQNAERIGYKSNFTIYDAADSKSLIKSIIKEMDLDDKVYKPNTVMSAISTAKNALISPEKYRTLKDVMEADKQSRRPLLYLIYRTYRDRCFSAGAMDFDDLLYYTNVLLRDNPDVLHHYQEFFRYILVDEYQDTNFAQHIIVSQLCKENPHLCVVGDDAQSIYSFRGANIGNILNLKNEYHDLRTFKLEQNYRSTQNIINAANTLIDKNTQQIRKQVYSKNDIGRPIEIVKAYSDFEEGHLVANRISQVKMRTHDSYEEFAILYRTNAQSRVLEESLRKRNIPYRIYGGLSFYQRKEVKDAIAYFRLSINPTDDEALRRVINYPARSIGETTVNKLWRCAIDNNVSIWDVMTNLSSYDVGINSGTAKKLNSFCQMIQGFIDMNQEGHNASEVGECIIDKTRLLAVLYTDRTPENLSRQENINELRAGLKQFIEDRAEEGRTDISLSDFLSEVSLATDQDSDDDSGDGITERVTLMTVHAAKGLEFNNVFIVGVEENLFPSSMCGDDPAAIEEERRLLYVAITRARNVCVISYASQRYRNGQYDDSCKPSRFIGDIDDRFLSKAHSEIYGNARRPMLYSTSITDRTSPRFFSTRLNQSRQRQEITEPRRPQTPAKVQSAEGFHYADELRVGMKIDHSRFGVGVINDIDTTQAGDRILVTFDDTSAGQKTLLLKFARFKIL